MRADSGSVFTNAERESGETKNKVMETTIRDGTRPARVRRNQEQGNGVLDRSRCGETKNKEWVHDRRGCGQTKHKGGTVGDRMCRSFSQTYLTFTEFFLPEGKILKCEKSQGRTGVCGDGENCIKGQRKGKLKRGWGGARCCGKEYLINNFRKP
jgi:hypothetical protein